MQTVRTLIRRDGIPHLKQLETYRLLLKKMLRKMKKLSEGDPLTPESKQAPVDFLAGRICS